MVNDSISRTHLVDALCEEVGLARNECARLLEDVLVEITTRLVDGEAVKLSSFCSFSVRSKKGRMGRNPKTGEEVPISPRRVVVFRPSQVLKDKMNGKQD